MRVLHLDSGRGMRGGQWQALRLHRALLGAGHESTLLAPEDSPLRQHGAEPLRPLRIARLSRGFDVIHAHDARSHTLCALFARAPFVVSRRVAFPIKKSLVSRWKYRRPALFLAVSRFVSRQLQAAGIPDDRIKIVYDGVPVPERPAAGDAVLAPLSPDPGKGTALAEESARIAGVALRLSSDLETDLPGAKALVYLSRSEGLGSGILLAMAHGVTVIASDTGGIPELIEDGVTGILVGDDPVQIASAFQRIEPRLGVAARDAVENRFTVDHLLRATLAAYRKALGHV